jgi:UDP-N-acetylmuramoyl-tripeptide--D-alanyl-D-alanine ligase
MRITGARSTPGGASSPSGWIEPADVTGTWTAPGHLLLRLAGQEHHLSLAFPGRHNAMNALAAAAAATAADIPHDAILRGLTRVHPVSGRLTPRPAVAGALLLDDSYNANPASTFAALEVLAAYPGERCVALGDMGELGGDAQALHEQVGAARASWASSVSWPRGPCRCTRWPVTAKARGTSGSVPS